MLAPEFWSGALGAAVVTGVFGVVLAVIGWLRGARPDARAEMELALETQRATIERLQSNNQTLENVLSDLRGTGRADQRTISALEKQIALNDIYVVRLEVWANDLAGLLDERSVPYPPRPARPAVTSREAVG